MLVGYMGQHAEGPADLVGDILQGLGAATLDGRQRPRLGLGRGGLRQAFDLVGAVEAFHGRGGRSDVAAGAELGVEGELAGLRGEGLGHQ